MSGRGWGRPLTAAERAKIAAQMDLEPVAVPGPALVEWWKNSKVIAKNSPATPRPIALLPKGRTVAVGSQKRTIATTNGDGSSFEMLYGLDDNALDDIRAGETPRTVNVLGRTRHRQHRSNQWHRWITEVIPSLMEPYMELMRDSDSLQKHVLRDPSNVSCACIRHGDLEITCISLSCTFVLLEFETTTNSYCA